MPGEKRPSSKLPDDVVARAKELRLADPRRWTFRALEAELGYSKSALADALAADPELAAARATAAVADDVELREELRDTARAFVVTLRAAGSAIDEAIAIVRTEGGGEHLKSLAATVQAAAKTVKEAIKLSRLLAGEATDHVAVNGKVTLGPPARTPDEERLLAALPPAPSLPAERDASRDDCPGGLAAPGEGGLS